MNEWRTVFWITFGVFVVTTIIYCIWASGELQPWNDPVKMKLLKGEQYSKDLEATDMGGEKVSKEQEANEEKVKDDKL